MQSCPSGSFAKSAAKNPVINVFSRIYLEIVRIMPQMVLLFIVYFGATKAHIAVHQSDHKNDKDHKSCDDDRNRGGVEGGTADH